MLLLLEKDPFNDHLLPGSSACTEIPICEKINGHRINAIMINVVHLLYFIGRSPSF